MITGAQVAIITGGASGIGRALAAELLQQQVTVIIADRQVETGNQVQQELSQLNTGAKVEFQPLDVAEFDQVKALVDKVYTQHGRLDYLFNNAGIAVGGFASDYELKDWTDVINVNLLGVIHGVHAAYPYMKAQGFGAIVNTASLSGLIPSPMSISYTASKYGVIGLSRALRPEAAASNVQVNVVCPGVVRTSILDDGGEYGRMASSIPKAKADAFWESRNPVSAEVCARGILDGVENNREIIFVPEKARLAWWIERLLPSVLTRRLYKELAVKFEGGFSNKIKSPRIET